MLQRLWRLDSHQFLQKKPSYRIILIVVLIVLGCLFVLNILGFGINLKSKRHLPNYVLSEGFVAPPVTKEYTLWSTSFHISPIYCLRHFLKNVFEIRTGIRVNVIEESLSGHCHLTKTCASDLKILDKSSATGEKECTVPVARDFYNAYKDDERFKKVDVVMCDHNIAICELYMAFDLPMIVYATTRYELWRHKPERWKNLNHNLKLISQKPHNTIIANNLYDSKYLNYFTGLEVPVVDSFCGYSADEGIYNNPKRREILIGPSRINIEVDAFFSEVLKMAKTNGKSLKLAPIRSLYKTYKYSDLIQHPAIVIVPYQLSVMSFFEYYRMGLPIYFPSVDLLTKWHLEHRIIDQKTWNMALYKEPATGSQIDPDPRATVPKSLDPNNDLDPRSVRYWNNFGDLYQWPHIIIFDSMEDLYNKLTTATPQYYKEVSSHMQQYNKELVNNLVEQWKKIFERVEAKRQQGISRYETFEQAMSKLWQKHTLTCNV